MSKIQKKRGKSKLEGLKTYLNRKYQFQYNTVANSIEHCLRGSKEYTQVHLKTLLDEIRSNVISTISSSLLEEVIGSFLFSKPTNPLKAYFEGLKIDFDFDPFDDLVNLIELDGEEGKNRLKKALKKWFVSAITVIFDPRKPPKQMIVFQGGSGIGKTPFLTNFFPPIFDKYVKVCPHLDPSNKDSKLDLARCGLILFDEIDDYFKASKNRNNFKSYATQRLVNVRPPYAKVPELRYRIASFLGTCNESTFLNDPTGSQRFVVFNVAKIWNKKALREAKMENLMPAEDFDVEKCWASAYKLYKERFDPEYSTEELVENEKINERYKYNSPEFETMREIIEASEPNVERSEFMTSTEIMNYLNGVQAKISFTSVVGLGKSLQRLGFKKNPKKINGNNQYGYWVKKLTEKSSLTPF